MATFLSFTIAWLTPSNLNVVRHADEPVGDSNLEQFTLADRIGTKCPVVPVTVNIAEVFAAVGVNDKQITDAIGAMDYS